MQIVSKGHNLHEMSEAIFFEKLEKNVNSWSAEFAYRVVKVKMPFKIVAENIVFFFFIWENKAKISGEMSHLFFF